MLGKLYHKLGGARALRWVFVGSLLKAAAELATALALVLFMSVVQAPSAAPTVRPQLWLQQAAASAGLSYLGFSTGLMFAVLVGGKLIGFMSSWLRERFIWSAEVDLSGRLLEGYLGLPLEKLYRENTARAASDLKSLGPGLIRPFVGSIEHLVVIGLLGSVVLLVDPVLTLAAGLVLLLTQAILLKIMATYHDRLGRAADEAGHLRMTTFTEAVSGAATLKSSSVEPYFRQRFRRYSKESADLAISHCVTRDLPQYLLEGMALAVITVLSIVIVKSELRGPEQLLPLLSLYAFAAHRMLPAAHALFVNLSTLRYHLNLLHRYLDVANDRLGGEDSAHGPAVGAVKTIELKAVSFTYEGQTKPVLTDVSLRVEPGHRIGLTGETGAGKTTLIHLLLGLLRPRVGEVLFDDGTVNSAVGVGYVPQSLFFTDDSIRANVAFGVESVDQMAVERACREAEIDEFIRRLPQGYDTPVGEGGALLSGGQRQRLGLARALYHNPAMLILDEATSALDPETEKRLMGNLVGRTLVVISHRPGLIASCDRVYTLVDGRVLESEKTVAGSKARVD